jgi:hypothetical protein
VSEPVSQTDVVAGQRPASRYSSRMPATGSHRAKPPSWWHRGHPVFTPLAGFYTGLLFIIVVPLTASFLLRIFLSDDAASKHFVWILVLLLIPAGLVAAPQTRRFGWYMWLGMILTAIVVVGVVALVLWRRISSS